MYIGGGEGGHTVLIITVGHRPFPVQLAHAAGQCLLPADKMADRKRSESLGESSSCSKRSKRQVTVATCESGRESSIVTIKHCSGYDAM